MDLNSGETLGSDVTHQPCQISADGNTIAVAQLDRSQELGLSLDAGKSFVWTRPGTLVRCQDSRVVASGTAMFVSCVSGVERWIGGSAGTASLGIVAAAPFASGARVVIGAGDLIQLSPDSGGHFFTRGFMGIAGGGSVVALSGDMIYATGRSEDSRTRLYIAHWDAPFVALADDLPVSHASVFDSSGDVLTVYDGARIFVRRHEDERFREVEVVPASGTKPLRGFEEIHYAFGNLYVLSEAQASEPGGRTEVTMYVAALPQI